MTSPPRRAVAADRSRDAVLEAATRVLLESPQSSLSDIAVAIGIGRTTLHRMFPTRQALVAAVAHDALDHLAEVYARAGLPPEAAVGDDEVAPPPDGAVAAIGRLAELLVPLGPRLMFLLRAPELQGDDDTARRSDELDAPMRDAVGRAQAKGELDPALPTWWVVECFNAGVYIAWEQVDRGRLAALDAAPLVMRTWLAGVRPPA